MSFYDKSAPFKLRANNVIEALRIAQPINTAYRVVGMAEFTLGPALLAINKFVTPVLSEGATHIGAQLLLVTGVAWAISEVNLEVRKFHADEIIKEAESKIRDTKNIGSRR